VTCPNGVTRRITARRKVTFGVACRGCPLPERCTTRTQGRSLNLHPDDAILRQARHDWADREDLRDTYRQHRPMVERSIAWLIGPKNRCRQLRYRGVTSNNQRLGLRMAALNLRRMINLGLQPAAGGGWIIPQTA
jgi:Transposase DDE domain